MKATTSGFVRRLLLASTAAVTALAAATAPAPPALAANNGSTVACPNLHIIAARESTTPQGFGAAQTLVDLVLHAFPGATAEALVYPAAGGSNQNYSTSVTAGVLAVLAQVSQFAAACPETVLVLHGYSQGAQVIDDAFCGGPDGASLSASPSLIQNAIGANVAAVVLMGNPRHVAGLPFNVGNATASGFAARPAGFECPLYQSRMQSYCDSPDPYCANGTDAQFHEGYGKRNGVQALQFIVSKVIV
ncbi:acetylxylan esterase precursor [Niveomyces insectorum RCEF 264]|uniref:Acetylxylan esterase n=1 Tax=Niveomyces insectorum RCEF 264 TaxID=1081102 RepID=A0A167RFW5_9HYPO|nr:acetylxylan esterase precursor [Niveomyces insectorum RCEF 264]